MRFCGRWVVARDISQQEIGEGVARCDIRVAAVLPEAAAIGRVATKVDRREFSTETIVEYRAHRETGRQRHGSSGGEENMIARIAGYEFIEECRRNIRVQTSHEA